MNPDDIDLREETGIQIFFDVNQRSLDEYMRLIRSWRRHYLWARLLLIPAMTIAFVWWVMIRVALLILIGQAKKRLQAQFARTFLHYYLSARKISVISAPPFESQYKGPKLIVISRSFPMAPFLVYQELEQPLIIPYIQHFQRFWPFPLPIDPLSSCVPAFSYSDVDLHKNIENIEALLEAGYPVLIYANRSVADPNFANRLYLDDALMDMLQWQVPTYFCNIRSLDMMKYASPMLPCMVRLNFESKESLFEKPVDYNWDYTAHRIAQFLGFKFGYWTPSPDAKS